MQQYLQNKERLVHNVFNKVYDKYDLMNDFMSLGIHRIWKKNFINMMNPASNKKLIDVACGTGYKIIDFCKRHKSFRGVGLDISKTFFFNII